jgi:hypothetical protein
LNDTRNPSPTLRLAGITAVVAAIIASAGDFFLIYVANAPKYGFGLTGEQANRWLLVGHYCGVLAIPLYSLGYWHVSRGLAAAGHRISRSVFALGVYTSAVGSAIHGLTAFGLHASSLADAQPSPHPLGALTPPELVPYLLPLWALVGLAMLAGSALYAFAVFTRPTAYPKWGTLLNPALLVVAGSALALLSPLLTDFLVVWMPNLGHILFFAFSTAALWHTDA